MSAELSSESKGRYNLVKVRGSMERDDNAMELFAPVYAALALGITKFVIDLTGADINGHLAGEISLLNAKLRKHRGEIRFVGISDKTKEIFQLMGLLAIFKKFIFNTPDEAEFK